MTARAALRRRIVGWGRAALRDLPPRTRELALSLVTSRQDGPLLLPGPPAGPVLVIAPHPDDEAIGPGGAVARHVDAGDDVTVLVLTSGGATAGGGSDVTAVREEESRRALHHLGVVTDPVFGRLPDGGLATCPDQVADLIARHGGDAMTVYVPSLLDPHPDHRAAAVAVARAGLRPDATVFGYEVWAAGPVTALLDVTDVFGRKQAALAEYHVALQTVDYVRSASGLAAYRSAMGALGGRGFAEGFLAVPLPAYQDLV